MYCRRRPHPSLAAHINYYWYVSDAPKDERLHVVPSGTLEVVINLNKDETRICHPADPSTIMRYSGAVVSGAQSRHFVVDLQAHATIIGVHFKPGGAFALLGVPPGSLTDGHANLQGVWGARAIELRERLLAACDADERFRILDAALLQKLRLQQKAQQRGEVTFALQRLFKTNARVDQVAAEVDLSHRRFIELFAAEVGVAPKVFSRVGRFQRALTMAKEEALPDWTQLALTCGYFDQSHLIREFVSLSGFAPKKLLRGSAEAQGHHAAVAGHRG